MSKNSLLVGLPHHYLALSRSRWRSVQEFMDTLSANYRVRLSFFGSPGEGRKISSLVSERRKRLSRMVESRLLPEDVQAVLILNNILSPSALRLASFASQAPTILVLLEEVAGSGSCGQADSSIGRPYEIWQIGKHPRHSAWLPAESLHRSAGVNAAWIQERISRLMSRNMSMETLSSIVIPCWNSVGYTKKCLESVRKWTNVPYEIIVVDNGSTDGTERFIDSVKDVRLIRNPTNLGFAKAINQGMAAANGDYIVWLNNDVIVTPDWLQRLLRASGRAPWIGAVGPYTNEIYGGGMQKLERVPYKKLEALPGFARAWSKRCDGKLRWARHLSGFCFLLKRSVLRHVGGLDERFNIGNYEDFDFSLRLRQSGYELYISEDVFVHHYGHRTFLAQGVPRHYERNNQEIFVEKWCRHGLSFLDEIHPRISRPTDIFTKFSYPAGVK